MHCGRAHGALYQEFDQMGRNPNPCLAFEASASHAHHGLHSIQEELDFSDCNNDHINLSFNQLPMTS